MTNRLLEEVKRMKAIADTGLLYAANEYDKERYAALQSISYTMLEMLSEHPLETLKISFPASVDYPTPKVDIRGLLINENNELLLVRESADGRWSLPGGWSDIGYSLKEVIIKEFKEETGLDVTAERLLAIFDKKMHPHPPEPFYVYKIVFTVKR